MAAITASKRGRPKGRQKPEKVKANFRLPPEDDAFITELAAKIDPWGHSKSRAIHELIDFYRHYSDSPNTKSRLAMAAPPAA